MTGATTGGDAGLPTENPRRRTREPVLRAAADRLVPAAEVARAAAEIASWAGYVAAGPVALPGLAREAGLASIHYQNEGRRFGLDSFKAWGGAYATARLLARRAAARAGRPDVSTAELAAGRFRDETAGLTVTCATDGNHGRAVAWAARTFGGRAVVWVAEVASDDRVRQIEELGARVIRSTGNHEVASAECGAAARAAGWHIITETEHATEPAIARDILSGYGALWEAALAPLALPPTHLFVQAGVGGLAAVAAAVTARRFGAARPALTVVEAAGADCIRRSLRAGERRAVDGRFETRLAGLAAGATSTYAWELLDLGADFATTIADAAAERTMQRLAEPAPGDPAIVAGGSGAAGLAGLLECCTDPAARARLGLDRASRVLVIGTEGATDPARYEEIVGRPPTAVGADRP